MTAGRRDSEGAHLGNPSLRVKPERAHSSMDRASAFEAADAGSIPAGRTNIKLL